MDLLEVYGQIETRDEASTIRQKLVAKVLDLDRELEPSLPALLALLDVPVDSVSWQALDPPQRRRHTVDAIKRLLVRTSREQPVLLVIEDLHWIDAESQALLDSLVESLPATRILLLVSYRPEYRHGWAGKSFYTQLRIDVLPRDAAEALLDALLGPDESMAVLRQRLIDQTEGNPFYLEECVRALIETGARAGERGRTTRRITCRRSSSRLRSSPCWRRASTACRPSTSACSRPPPSSGLTSRTHC